MSAVRCPSPLAWLTRSTGPNTPNEPTEARETATNEPTEAREIAPNEPTEARETATNEPTEACEIVTNELTEIHEITTNKPTEAHENETNEPKIAAKCVGGQRAELNAGADDRGENGFEEGFSVKAIESIQRGCEGEAGPNGVAAEIE
jgi:hypothetical protein